MTGRGCLGKGITHKNVSSMELTINKHQFKEVVYASSVSRPVCSRATAALLSPINFIYTQVQLHCVTSTTAGTGFHRSVIFLVCKIQPYLHFTKPPPNHKTPAAASRAPTAAPGASALATKGSSFCKDDHSLLGERAENPYHK